MKRDNIRRWVDSLPAWQLFTLLGFLLALPALLWLLAELINDPILKILAVLMLVSIVRAIWRSDGRDSDQ